MTAEMSRMGMSSMPTMPMTVWLSLVARFVVSATWARMPTSARMMASWDPTFAASLNASIHWGQDGRVSFWSRATAIITTMP